MATDGHIENVLQKKMVLETGVIPLFLSNVSHRAHFWNHSAFWQVWMSKFKMPFPLFSDLSHPIHCSCWMSHQKLVSSNTCWFYMVLLHIFPQGSPNKVDITNFSNRKSIISSSIPLNWCHKMNCNDNDWYCWFNLEVYYRFICQCIFLLIG